MYAADLTAGAAIWCRQRPESGAGSQNIRIFRMDFPGLPQGVVFQNTLQGLVEQCTFTFKHQPMTCRTADHAHTARRRAQSRAIRSSSRNATFAR